METRRNVRDGASESRASRGSKIEDVSGSRVYPGSGPHPSGPAGIRTPGSWGQVPDGKAQATDGSHADRLAVSSYKGTHGHGASVHVPVGDVTVEGTLYVPRECRGIVLFSHGSGSMRLTPRVQREARVLQDGGLATLLFDLLTPEEEELDEKVSHLRFDIALLAKRLARATDWVVQQPQLKNMNIGYFGSDTGAGAALVCAVNSSLRIRALVSAAGHPDLARSALAKVKSPTLLMVGEEDTHMIESNWYAFNRLRAEKRIEIFRKTKHAAEEKRAVEQMARMARDWFKRHLNSERTHVA